MGKKIRRRARREMSRGCYGRDHIEFWDLLLAVCQAGWGATLRLATLMLVMTVPLVGASFFGVNALLGSFN
ncbi:hypothetical protein GCM10007979_39430 [Nocardioides albus]|nr:hypothetical protein GCM10007979_39430 [Nocardioides albus]